MSTSGQSLLRLMAEVDALRNQAGEALIQVGWLGPRGLIPGGMRVQPQEGWVPVWVRQPLDSEPVGAPRRPDGTIAEPHPLAGERWADQLTVPAEELQPYDRLVDGRYILELHSSGGRWVSMAVAYCQAEVDVIEILGHDSQCLWSPRILDPIETIPVPRELTVFRGGGLMAMGGYTCTAPGRPDECESCPARP